MNRSMNSDFRTGREDGFRCLIVDDDQSFSGMISRIVRAEGGEDCVCPDLRTANEVLSTRSFDLVLLDNYLPDGTGYEFYARLMRRLPEAVVVMITGAPQLSEAIALTRNGLFDYLTKPVTMDGFTACLRRAKQRLAARETAEESSIFIGTSPALRQAVQQLDQAARHPGAPVLLLGETGTGKDLAARYIHQRSVAGQGIASNSTYVALNCPAVPSDMFEAELFGSEKGAYTGAERRRQGLVEAADGGTLFLDEVAEIPLTLQPKLLRFLESREYRLLGSTVMRQFNGRVIAATNRDLRAEVANGRFRADLMYRLDVFTVRLPPLRGRSEDVAPLAESMLTSLCQKYGRVRPNLRPIDLAALREYPFPGNVRELRNLIERSLLRLQPDDPWLIMDLEWLQQGSGGSAVVAAASSARTPFSVVPHVLTPIETQEYHLIAQALEQEGGSIRRAAAKVGISHQTLIRRLQKWPELRRGSPEIAVQG